MGDLKFEDNLIAGAIQSRDVFRRAKRAGIDDAFFDQNDFNAYVFKTCAYLDRIGNEFTASAFEDVIAHDPSLDSKEKGPYMSRIIGLSRSRYENVSLTLDIMKEQAKEKQVHRILTSAAMSVKRGDNPEEIIEFIRHGMDRIDVQQDEYELIHFYDEAKARGEERKNRDAAGGSFRFLNNFLPFDRYFPGGLPGGTTMTASGPTFSGKSIVLSNAAVVGTHPSNGIDVVYVVSENTKALTGNRLDAMYLGKDYNKLVAQGTLLPDEEAFFKNAPKNGWGKLVVAKVQSKRFTANTIRSILDECIESGLDPKLLLIDSPDHQRSLHKSEKRYEEKGDVYLDNKNVAEEYDLAIIASAPLKAGSKKTNKVDNEQIAGSQDISRHVDFQLIFNTSEEDELLDRARLVVAKNREYLIVDGKNVDFKFSNSLILQPWEEAMAWVDDDQNTVYIRHNGQDKKVPVPELPKLEAGMKPIEHVNEDGKMEYVDPRTGEVSEVPFKITASGKKKSFN